MNTDKILRIGHIRNGQDGEVIDERGICPTHTAGHGRCPKVLTTKRGGGGLSLSIKEATNKGYKEAYEGDSVVLDFPNSSTRRGRVGDQVLSGKEPVKGRLHKVGYLKAHETSTEHQSNRFYDEEEISPTIDTMNGGNLQPKIINSNLTIRKLTPKECFRLMDFDDSDYQILVDNGFSDSQIYKFAGNSIVVRLLMYIFSELLGLDIL